MGEKSKEVVLLKRECLKSAQLIVTDVAENFLIVAEKDQPYVAPNQVANTHLVKNAVFAEKANPTAEARNTNRIVKIYNLSKKYTIYLKKYTNINYFYIFSIKTF